MERKDTIEDNPYKSKSWLVKELRLKTISQIAKEQNCSRQNIIYFMDKFGLKSPNGRGKPFKYISNKERKEAFLEAQSRYKKKRADSDTDNIITGISGKNSNTLGVIREETKRNNDSIIGEMLDLFVDKHNISLEDKTNETNIQN